MQKQNLNEKSDDFGCHNSHSDSRGPVARLHCKSGSPTLHWSPKCNAVSFSPIGTGKENGHIIQGVFLTGTDLRQRRYT